MLEVLQFIFQDFSHWLGAGADEDIANASRE